MNHGGEIIRKLLRIRKAESLLASETSTEKRERLSELIMDTQRDIPSLVFSHITRLEALGRAGFAEVREGKCSSCGAEVVPEELEYLRRENIGVCDKCFAFLYVSNPDIENDEGLIDAFGEGDNSSASNTDDDDDFNTGA